MVTPTCKYYGVYSFRNPSDKTIVVDTKGNTEIPFIKMPEGTSTMGYETLQDSAPILNTDKGIAIPPSDTPYGLLAFTSLPKQEKFRCLAAVCPAGLQPDDLPA